MDAPASVLPDAPVALADDEPGSYQIEDRPCFLAGFDRPLLHVDLVRRWMDLFAERLHHPGVLQLWPLFSRPSIPLLTFYHCRLPLRVCLLVVVAFALLHRMLVRLGRLMSSDGMMTMPLVRYLTDPTDDVGVLLQ